MNKSYTLMELEAIKKLCKCVNSVANLPTNLIADTNVATNTTYSSYKIDAEMSALENDIQTYVDTALAGLSRLTKEVIDDKALVVKENVLYLYKDPTDMNNDYMQMMLINGVAVELGSTTCDFSSVYSKDDVDAKFALKIDLDTLTTSFNEMKDKIGDLSSLQNPTLAEDVAGKVDKANIVTVLDNTVTDEQIPSAKVVYDNILTEEDVLAIVNKEGLKFIDDANDETLTNGKYATKTTTTNLPVSAYGILIIEKFKDTNSTWVKQTYKPLADQIYVRSKINDLDYTDWQKITVAVEKTFGQPVVIEDELDLFILDTNATFTNSNTGTLVDLTGKTLFRIEHKVVFSSKSYIQIAYDITTGKLIATRSKNWWNSTWSPWNLICTTRVKDEANVDVTSSFDTTVATINSIAYTVKNGICYVRVNNLKPLVACNETVILPNGTLPKASTSLCYANINTWSETTMSTILLQPNTNGSLDLWCNSNALNKAHYGMFSYPVAE